jgi:hypothetical protein
MSQLHLLLNVRRDAFADQQQRLANDMVYPLSVNAGPNNFEFERVIFGQRLAGLRWEQLGLSLNFKRCMFGAGMLGVPHFDSGL